MAIGAKCHISCLSYGRSCSCTLDLKILLGSDSIEYTVGRWLKEKRVTVPYLIWKCLLAAYFSIHFIAFVIFTSMNTFEPYTKYMMVFFTNWSYVLITVACTLDAILTITRFLFKIENSNKYFNFGLKISIWSTCTIYPIHLLITVVYWAFLHNFNPEKAYAPLQTYFSLNQHLIPIIFAIIDTIVSARPWKKEHLWCPILYLIIYMIFNLLYSVAFKQKIPCWKNDGTYVDYIYPILDYNNKPRWATLAVLGLIVLSIISYFMFCFIAKLRDFAWKKYFLKNDSSATNFEM